MNRQASWLGWLLATLMTAVLTAVGAISTTHPTHPPHPTQPPSPVGRLVPADSRYPAAGICLSPAGQLAVVRINPDTPDPRCSKVTPAQRLRVVNATNGFGQPGHEITVRFADFAPRVLGVGRATTYNRPFGDYLARGDHFLKVDGGGGADVCLCPWISAG